MVFQGAQVSSLLSRGGVENEVEEVKWWRRGGRGGRNEERKRWRGIRNREGEKSKYCPDDQCNELNTVIPNSQRSSECKKQRGK